MLSPLGTYDVVIRSDAVGNGHFQASRGYRKHNGIDLVVIPGDKIVSPIRGKVTRKIQVYSDDKRWTGLEIIGKNTTHQIYYIKGYDELIGQQISAGTEIGIAQDISQKYGKNCMPHIHWQIFINPEILLGL